MRGRGKTGSSKSGFMRVLHRQAGLWHSHVSWASSHSTSDFGDLQSLGAKVIGARRDGGISDAVKILEEALSKQPEDAKSFLSGPFSNEGWVSLKELTRENTVKDSLEFALKQPNDYPQLSEYAKSAKKERL